MKTGSLFALLLGVIIILSIRPNLDLNGNLRFDNIETKDNLVNIRLQVQEPTLSNSQLSSENSIMRPWLPQQYDDNSVFDRSERRFHNYDNTSDSDSHYFEKNQSALLFEPSTNSFIPTSKGLNLDYLYVDPIIIHNDTELQNAGFSGSGTNIDPYVIDGYNTTIIIENTTLPLEIKNNYLITNLDFNLTTSLLVNQSKNIVITNNVVNYSHIGIWTTLSSGIQLTSNLIKNTVYGIVLDNSNNVTVANNEISNASVGMFHQNNNNNTISSNILTNNGKAIYSSDNQFYNISSNKISNSSSYGLSLSRLENSVVSNNVIYNSTGSGIEIAQGTGTSILNNTITNGANGIDVMFEVTEPLIIKGNIIANNTVNGVEIYEGSLIQINENIITNNSGDGIHFQSGIFDYNITITKNTLSYNRNAIYYIGQATFYNIMWDINIVSNTISYNYDTGLDITAIYKSNIRFNTIQYNQGPGISIWGVNDIIANNTIQYNQGNGIDFRGNQDSQISNNTISGNVLFGISAHPSDFGNKISSNKIFNNQLGGILLDQTRNYEVANNHISNSVVGISLLSAEGTYIHRNTIHHNSENGILLNSSRFNFIGPLNELDYNLAYGLYVIRNSYSNYFTGNIFGLNNFIGPAYNDGPVNKFYNNYWKIWVQIDDNSDGIVDTPFHVPGNAQNLDLTPIVSNDYISLIPPIVLGLSNYSILPDQFQELTWMVGGLTPLDYTITLNSQNTVKTDLWNGVLISINHTPSPVGKYLYKLTVTDANGKIAESTIQVDVGDIQTTIEITTDSGYVTPSSSSNPTLTHENPDKKPVFTVRTYDFILIPTTVLIVLIKKRKRK